MSKINIAIDGYSSCGKSTLAKRLAQSLSYVFIDTGAMYRAVTLFALQNGYFNNKLSVDSLIFDLNKVNISFQYNAERQASDVILNGVNVENEIRTMEVSNHVSEIAEVKEVRKKLVALQQEMGRQKGVVMDGRDIGTVVFPKAELKIFMTADDEVRAMRRFDELRQEGDSISLAEVRENLKKRDHIDTHRKEDPLRQAEDAIVLDNSNLNQEQQFELALRWANERM
ncbi:MAG: cytidylate kinase [Crocinitomicaceae bacterium]|nr:cytidylate kinase [Crocinitomicaceae bacterium]|tara:strand:- start:2870 stop:3550 length:681 start_codon:yes stop_codon:yes gene_type:complete